MFPMRPPKMSMFFKSKLGFSISPQTISKWLSTNSEKYFLCHHLNFGFNTWLYSALGTLSAGCFIKSPPKKQCVGHMWWVYRTQALYLINFYLSNTHNTRRLLYKTLTSADLLLLIHTSRLWLQQKLIDFMISLLSLTIYKPTAIQKTFLKRQTLLKAKYNILIRTVKKCVFLHISPGKVTVHCTFSH